jgi:DNA-binding transcriptional LysR family regulator
MEFYHLRSFALVAKTGNLTLAAKQLCTTPPSISAHIKALEEELQTVLFIRSSKGMQLTSKGSVLLTQAQKTLDSALDMVNLAAQNQSEVIGHFTLAINQHPSQVNIAVLLVNLKENCPGITLNISPMATAKIINSVRYNRVDGGYIYGKVPDDLLAIKVKQQKITTIAPREFDKSQLNLALCPWITMGMDCPFDDFLTQKLGSTINSVLSSSDENSRLELVKMGQGLSFIEQEQAETSVKHQQVIILEQLDFVTDLYFVVAKKRSKEPIIQALSQEIRVLWNIAL